MEYPELKRAVRERAEDLKATTVLIEDKSSGTALIQGTSKGGRVETDPRPQDEKKMRLNSVTSTDENGFVYLPEKATWLADYLKELTTSRTESSTTSATRPRRRSIGSKRARKNYNCEWVKHETEKAVAEIYGDHVGPCPFCGKSSISHEGSEVHCLNCDKRWDRPFRPHRVTRGDME